MRPWWLNLLIIVVFLTTMATVLQLLGVVINMDEMNIWSD